MGETIRNAVQLALGGFLSLAGGRRGADPRTPTAPAVEGAYQLGRGEARSGRTHRRAARGLPDRRPGLLARDVRRPRCAAGVAGRDAGRRSPSWSSPTSTSCPRPASPATPTSWRPPAGCAQRLLERLARHLLDGVADRDRAGRGRARRLGRRRRTLTAVLVPEAQVRPVLGRARRAAPCRPSTCPSLEDARAAAGARRARPPPRPRCSRALAGRGARRRPGAAVAGGARVVRPGAAGPRARASTRRHRGAPRPAGAARRPRGARRPARAGARAARRPAARHAPRSSPTPCAPGCCTTAAARTSPPSCSCTRRPCATGWASCASCTATGSTTRTRCCALVAGARRGPGQPPLGWSGPSPGPRRRPRAARG